MNPESNKGELTGSLSCNKAHPEPSDGLAHRNGIFHLPRQGSLKVPRVPLGKHAALLPYNPHDIIWPVPQSGTKSMAQPGWHAYFLTHNSVPEVTEVNTPFGV